MHVADFEELARGAPETVTLELRGGRLEVKPATDGDHATLLVLLTEQCLRQRPELGLYSYRGLEVGPGRRDRARPDGTLAPRRHFAGHGHWSAPDGVLMTVEITYRRTVVDRRDRREMRDGYAHVDIPVHLLVDRDAGELVVYTDPRNGAYKASTAHSYGTAVVLPDPVGITLDTEELKNYST